MKKYISIILVSILVFSSLITGCDKDKSVNASANIETKKTISDIYGRKVEVPKDVKKIVAVGAGGLRMVCYADAQDMVVGVEESEHKDTIAKGYNHVNYNKFKDLPIIGQGGAGGYTPYTEEIVKVNPDVIIAQYPKDLVEDLQSKTGIPVVSVYYEGIFGEDFDNSMKIIGDLLGKEKRCEDVVNFISECKNDLNKRTKDVPDGKKPKVFTGACSFCGGHGIEGTYTNFPPFKAINIKTDADALSDKPGGVVVDLEKIVEWDPDIIFLDPNNMSFVNDHYKDHKNFYKSLRAVKEGKVYSQVAYNWYTTNVGTAVINSYYAGKIIYPEQFKDINIEEKANDIYIEMFGKKANNLCKDMNQNGLSWKQLTIGE